jgi:ABC-type transporter Mla subunit MlaD
MSDDWIEDQALRFEGFTDAQIAQIEAAIPNAQSLVALVKKNEPDITQALTLAEGLLPVAYMVLTVIKQKRLS